MVHFGYCLTSLLFFDIPLLYINFIFILDHQQIFVFVTYLSLSISYSFVSELFCGEVFETLVISSAILFQIKIPVASAFTELLFLKQF